MNTSRKYSICLPQKSWLWILILLNWLSPANAQSRALEQCLQREVLRPQNLSLTIAELRAYCEGQATPGASTSAEISTEASPNEAPEQEFQYLQTPRNSFFEPYKRNYISFGSMRNVDGGAPFSGKTLDIKFELGMKFGLFPVIDEFQALSPLKFGYSQRSWWDVAEASAPFREHNYNPEIFWDFKESLARPSSVPRLHLFDLAGFEHQSNGLDGTNSRSWDRLYVSRTLRLSEMWAWTFKYWEPVNLGEYNTDIEDYLGNAQITTHVDVNNWAQVELNTLFGRESDKVSYQLDLILPMSRWVNSRFFLSYYNGYGEALISYNQKTTSLRAGFYFPLGF